jgi:hypothetical protein
VRDEVRSVGRLGGVETKVMFVGVDNLVHVGSTERAETMIASVDFLDGGHGVRHDGC